MATQAFDLSCLVGTEIAIFSEQFQGKSLTGRVISVQPHQITVERGDRKGPLSNLANLQSVVLRFSYKGQKVSVRARLKRSLGGTCNFILNQKATPLSQRRFLRLDLKRSVSMAAFPVATHSRRSLSSLRWVATDSVNLSSGGLLMKVPTCLQEGVYLLINVDWEQAFLPPMVLGRVCHSFQDEDGQFMVGIEFLVREESLRLLPRAARQLLPQSVFRYTLQSRSRLNRKLQLWNPDKESQFAYGSKQ
ncbi:MAG: hypothetical protein JSU65_09685 [Candidatus Zixiibacteriota bacterium]|nr:MAG: hypothetical protein JSU65_09685 [candidate division Zixibacteria bacterium]